MSCDNHDLIIERLNRFTAADEPFQTEHSLSMALILCERHFTAEEKAMAGARYPDLDNHRSQHQQILAIMEAWCDADVLATKTSWEKAAFSAGIVEHMKIADAKWDTWINASFPSRHAEGWAAMVAS